MESVALRDWRGMHGCRLTRPMSMRAGSGLLLPCGVGCATKSRVQKCPNQVQVAGVRVASLLRASGSSKATFANEIRCAGNLGVVRQVPGRAVAQLLVEGPVRVPAPPAGQRRPTAVWRRAASRSQAITKRMILRCCSGDKAPNRPPIRTGVSVPSCWT